MSPYPPDNDPAAVRGTPEKSGTVTSYDQGMDVYVVTMNGTVIGAGASLQDAHTIADREAVGLVRWRPWARDGGTGSWSRSGAHAVQVITCVPLAGGAVPDFPLGPDTLKMMERDRAVHRSFERAGELYRDLITTQQRYAPPSVQEMIQLIQRAKQAAPINTGPMRAGSGEAWEWLRRGLDQMPVYPSEKALPDSVIAQVIGVDIVLDPGLPTNVLRLGDKVFIIDGDAVYETNASLLDGWCFPQSIAEHLGRPLFTNPRD
jgi:hypothetical protein